MQTPMRRWVEAVATTAGYPGEFDARLMRNGFDPELGPLASIGDAPWNGCWI
jgi:hypothetical protein